MGDLVTQDMEEAEVLNAVFASGFTSKTGLQESGVPEIRGEVWTRKDVPLLEEDLKGWHEHQRVTLPFRRTSTDWRNEIAVTSGCSARGSAKSDT